MVADLNMKIYKWNKACCRKSLNSIKGLLSEKKNPTSIHPYAENMKKYLKWKLPYRGSILGLLAAFNSSREAHCCNRSSVACLTSSASSTVSPSAGHEIWLKQRNVLVKSAPENSHKTDHSYSEQETGQNISLLKTHRLKSFRSFWNV